MQDTDVDEVLRVRKSRLLALGVLIWIIFWITKDRCKEEYEERYISNLHLKLTGVISYIVPSHDHNCGLIGLNVLSSNRDVVGKLGKDDEYCIVNKNKAEVYEFGSSQYCPGDTLIINTDIKKCFVHTLKGEVSEHTILLDTNDNFEDFKKDNSRMNEFNAGN